MKQPNSANAPQPSIYNPLPWRVSPLGMLKDANHEEVIAPQSLDYLAHAANHHAKLIRAVEILIADASVETAAVLAAMDTLKEVRG